MGKYNHQYKGGHTDSRGYIRIHVRGKYYLQHRYVMAKKLGRPLRANEQVHHKDGNKGNNKINNLEIVLKNVHYGQIACPHCNKKFKVK